MDIRKGNVQYLSDGSSALVPKPVHFRVIEGGRSCSDFSEVLRVREDSRTLHHSGSSQHAVNSLTIFFVICAMILVLTAAAVLMDTFAASRRTSSFANVSTEVVTVMPGDSIWSIAEEHPVEGCSTSEVVDFISEQNELSTSMITSGQHLYVPAS